MSTKQNLTSAGVPGVRVVSCIRDSPAWTAGIRQGDAILSIDGERTDDNIDVMYYSAEEEFEISYRRNGELMTAVVERAGGVHHGFTVEDPAIRECANRCPFCFVDQNPEDKGLRPGLQIRDDDYRYSFLYGHYVTLTNLSKRDFDRITSMRLSPLYVSVHATNPAVRAQLLGRKKADPMPLLRDLTAAGITCHTQIVLIEGINDGIELERTVEDLFALSPGVASVAVVPVGLTSYHHLGVTGWTKDAAAGAVNQIHRIATDYKEGFVQAADEWYSILGVEPPAIEYYGGMEVVENGVGLVRTMLDEWPGVRRRLGEVLDTDAGGSYLFITGQSPKMYIRGIVSDMAGLCSRAGIDIELRAAVNHTFGPDVTVTGLLGWRDIVREIGVSSKDTIVIPDVMLDGYKRFLDNVTIEEAEAYIRRRIKVVKSTAEGFLEGIALTSKFRA